MHISSWKTRTTTVKYRLLILFHYPYIKKLLDHLFSQLFGTGQIELTTIVTQFHVLLLLGKKFKDGTNRFRVKPLSYKSHSGDWTKYRDNRVVLYNRSNELKSRTRGHRRIPRKLPLVGKSFVNNLQIKVHSDMIHDMVLRMGSLYTIFLDTLLLSFYKITGTSLLWYGSVL